MALTKVSTPAIKDEAITLAKLLHGDSNSNGKFLRANNGADPTFETVSTDLVADTSPQLGGDLASNGNDILMGDNDEIKLGAGGDLKLEHQSSTGHSYITEVGTGNLYLQASNLILRDAGTLEHYLDGTQNGAVNLYYNGLKKFETLTDGAKITGKLLTIGDTGLTIEASSTSTAGQLTIIGVNASNQVSAITRIQSISTGSNTAATATTFSNRNSSNVVNEHMRIDSSGKVAIGTNTSNTSSNSPLTIKSSGSSATRFNLVNSGSSSVESTQIFSQNNELAFTASGSEKLRILNGGGITFNGDTATANALDDYEIGSWTPSAASGSFTQYNQAWYIKIGKLVTCYFYIYNFSDTSSSTNFVIGGLPYAYNNSPKHESFHDICIGGHAANFPSNTISVTGRIGQGSTTEMQFNVGKYNTASASLKHNMLGSVHLHTTFCYEAA